MLPLALADHHKLCIRRQRPAGVGSSSVLPGKSLPLSHHTCSLGPTSTVVISLCPPPTPLRPSSRRAVPSRLQPPHAVSAFTAGATPFDALHGLVHPECVHADPGCRQPPLYHDQQCCGQERGMHSRARVHSTLGDTLGITFPSL
jgi:hypothetical protein